MKSSCLIAQCSLLLLASLQAASGFGCLDHSGKEVDWFFTYKLPGGFDVAYLDSNTGPISTHLLEVTNVALDDKTNPAALTRTLISLVSSSSAAEAWVAGNETAALNASSTLFASAEAGTKPTYFMYNDQPDGAKPGSNYGHAKGVVGVSPSGTEAFWLIHSTPHFPSTSGKASFYFPEKEITYGQTFLCISLAGSDLETIGKQLRYTTPYVYFNSLPKAISSKHPSLQQVFDKDWVTDAGQSQNSFKVGSSTMKHFAKNGAANVDLYESAVAPGLGSDLLVETWLRGHKEGSYCKPKHKYKVLDVETMVAQDTDGKNTTWSEGADHSKWAVTLDSSNYVCVADMNRMTTQRDRGGGAMCFVHAGLANTLYNSVVTSFTCTSSSHSKHRKKKAPRGGHDGN